jgi:two-component system OmpR family sensor kinase
MKLNSLRVQLLSRSLLILAVVLMLIGALQYVFMRDVVYRDKASSLESQVMAISASTWEELSLLPSSEEPPRIFIPGASLAFIDTQGNYSVLETGRGEAEPPQLDALSYSEALTRHPGLNYQVVDEQLVVLQPVAVEPGTVLGLVQISTSTLPLTELLIRQLLTFFLLALVALVFGLLAFLPILKRTLVPLSNMVDTAAQINSGNLDRRFPTQQGQMEIDGLAESFNGMLERLEQSFAAERETQEKMRRFIADASHELRTPLTSIHGFLEVLLRGAVNQPEQLDKALKSMHSESLRLNKLVHDLLLLSKMDRTPHNHLEPGLLDQVITAMEPQLRILAGTRQLDLEIEPNLRSKYDIDQIKQVILNLFQNAVQHTDPEQGKIAITLQQRDLGIELAIRDNGPGISPDHLAHVFDRFYRSDSARARKDGGAGLGLSITKAIVESHGGTINVVSQEGFGCIFQVWLPSGGA